MPLPVDPEVVETSPASGGASEESTQATATAGGTMITPLYTSPQSSVLSSSRATAASASSSQQSVINPTVPVVPTPAAASSSSNFSTSLMLPTTSTSLRPQLTRSKSAMMTTITTNIVMGGPFPPLAGPTDLPSEPTDVPFTGVISANPNGAGGNVPTPPMKKSGGSVIGGVAGTISGLIIVGLLALFLWRWHLKQRWRNRRLSFGPHGNGIDANRGNVLVSSVACKPVDSVSIDENDDYFPPPPSRYFQPTVDTGRMLLRPIPSIAEVSERDSGDFEKTMPKLTLDFSAPSPNPFDDSHDVEKPKLLPEMSSFRRKPPPPPMSERSKQHLRSRSFDSLQEQQASVDVELDQAMRLGRMNYYNRHGGQQHDFYGNPQNHPYHRNGPINPLRMHSVQRTRRTASMSGRNPRYPRNPVLDGPAWRQALPPLQRPSLIHGIQFPVNSLQETTLTRAPSFRERPSPELWAGPKISAPLHLSRSNTHTARPRTVERSPDNSCSTAWGSVSNYVQGDRPGGVGTARNF